MDDTSYERELAHALEMMNADAARSAYWRGYRRGLGRGKYGEDFSADAEHLEWLALSRSREPRAAQWGSGYLDGLANAIWTRAARCG